jgi:RimJ/RimL family protein N-acetyltransferase/predicted N-acetyltransferase YhbS
MFDREAGTVTTRRLEIRPFSWTEVEALVAGSRLPGWADDYPDDGDQVIAGIIHRQGKQERPPEQALWGHHQIVERSSGQVVGGIGFFGRPSGGTTEVGYGIVPSRRGRGYAGEALHALVSAAWHHRYLVEVVAHTDLDNSPSQRVLEKAGFHHEGDVGDRRRYRLCRPDPSVPPRPAAAGEAAAVAALLDAFNREFATPTPGTAILEARLQRLLSSGQVVALVAGEPPVGVALVTLRPNVWYDGPVALLDELYVVPACRGHGVGSTLLAAAESLTRQRGGELFEINVDGDDTDARRFYQRHGYRNSEPDGDEPLLYYLKHLTGSGG